MTTRSSPTAAGDFFLLPPATYFVSMFNDENGNGKWDTGEYEEKRQAESVWFIKRGFQLKQDWAHETELWSVLELPLNEQKPDELLKEKGSKKKSDMHKKNVERLEKKSQQLESEKKKKESKRNERKERRLKNKLKYQNRKNSISNVPAPDVQEVETPEP